MIDRKKVIKICLIILFLTILFAWIIQTKDNREIKQLAKQAMIFQEFHQQIQLNNDVLLSFENDEVSKRTVDVSVSSLQNIYYLYVQNMIALDLVETKQFQEIDDLFDRYWQLTTFKNSISSDDILNIQKLGNRFDKIEEEISNKISNLHEKQKNYWWR